MANETKTRRPSRTVRLLEEVNSKIDGLADAGLNRVEASKYSWVYYLLALLAGAWLGSIVGALWL